MFAFDTAGNATSNIGTTQDFAMGSDRMVLIDEIFAALSPGFPASDMLRSGAGVTTAADANDYPIYDSTSGSPYDDLDGSGGRDATQFAALSMTLDLAGGGDFLVN